MKIAKKVLAAIMVVAMIAGLSAMAFAAGTPTVTLEPVAGIVKDKKGNDTIKVNVYFDNAIGLKSWDVKINFDPNVLEFKSIATGKDAEQAKTDNNSFTDDKNLESDGVLLYSGYFKENLWTAEEFSDDTEANIDINATHFHATTITFIVKSADATKTDLTAEVKTFSGEIAGLDGSAATAKLREDTTPVEPGTDKEEPGTDKEEPASGTPNPSTGDDKPTGDNMALVAASAVVVLAGAAFVISKKRK